ncbi:MAG: S46 family peptidase, partial [Flavobacteriales bacterium]
MKNLKRLFLSILMLCSLNTVAKEGMWLPMFLQQLNEAEMQAMGLELTAEDIYSINNGSLKDAIVHFGGGCTAEVISGEGLLLTNHHCGYGQIQSHSSVENDYLSNGFWAKDR